MLYDELISDYERNVLDAYTSYFIIINSLWWQRARWLELNSLFWSELRVLLPPDVNLEQKSSVSTSKPAHHCSFQLILLLILHHEQR